MRANYKSFINHNRGTAILNTIFMEQTNQTPEKKTMILKVANKSFEVESYYRSYFNGETKLFPYFVLLQSRGTDVTHNYLFMLQTWEEGYQLFKRYAEDKAVTCPMFETMHEFLVLFFNSDKEVIKQVFIRNY